jgi:3-methyladenine DNA glycosylase AlkD
MTAADIVKELESLGSAGTKRVLMNLKKIQKRVRKDHDLALELYATGIYDAQYLAGLIADERKMTPEDLRRWLAASNCPAISTFAVAALAAESGHGRELGLEWIESADEDTAQTGWTVLGGLVALQDEGGLDHGELARLLERVERTIHQQPNRVRYAMNGFVIGVGCYVRDLTDRAAEAGVKIGRVSVDMGNTACVVPYAPDYIQKVRARGTMGKKRKMLRC